MASPTIVINSATGNDGVTSTTATSGAGPGDGINTGSVLRGATATVIVNGSAVAGRRVLLADAPDLTNVAIDGSMMIYIAVQSTTLRGWSQIEGKGNSLTAAAYVDVTQPFGVVPSTATTGVNDATSRVWSIGGARASLMGAESRKLIDHGSSGNFDAPVGSTLLMIGNHSEASATAITPRVSASSTLGLVDIKWDGTGAMPVITMTNTPFMSSTGESNGTRWTGISFQSSVSNAQSFGSFNPIISGKYIGCVFGSVAKPWTTLAQITSVVEGCGIYATGGVSYSNGSNNTQLGNVNNCFIYTATGITYLCGGGQGIDFTGNVVIVTGTGVPLSLSQTGTGGQKVNLITGNTFVLLSAANASAGLTIASTAPATGTFNNLRIENNIVYSAGAGTVGIQFTGTGVTSTQLDSQSVTLRNNNIFGFASRTNSQTPAEINPLAYDPQFAATGSGAAAGDYAIGTNLAAQAWPGPGTIAGTLIRSYLDVGALQRQESGGGIKRPSMYNVTLKGGTTSRVATVFAQDATSSTGAGLSVGYNTASLAARYRRAGQSTYTSITLVTATPGTYTSGGLVADGSSTGSIEFGVPNAVIASGAAWAEVEIYGAMNLVPIKIHIELVAYDPQDATRLGLTALPNATAGGSGGIPTLDSSGNAPANVMSLSGQALTYSSGTGVVTLAAGVSIVPTVVGAIALNVHGAAGADAVRLIGGNYNATPDSAGNAITLNQGTGGGSAVIIGTSMGEYGSLVWSDAFATVRDITGGSLDTNNDKTGYSLSNPGVTAVQSGLATAASLATAQSGITLLQTTQTSQGTVILASATSAASGNANILLLKTGVATGSAFASNSFNAVIPVAGFFTNSPTGGGGSGGLTPTQAQQLVDVSVAATSTLVVAQSEAGRR